MYIIFAAASKIHQFILWKCANVVDTYHTAKEWIIMSTFGGIISNGFHIEWMLGTQDNWKN